ncbi:glycosyltransferase family 2 protein [Methanomicrobium antiquum]|uniref:Glycosyltransferase family 2 protein n=1 Tax=Methanomicrobium antiquum TaxID=487686 RepID=A0AAF0FXE0_9EURY|nr:glycosyltransferase family 2 protein [Methanomicrobium antiquum]WFN36784.1 glycosyltransferase family 2 protein [Methanomicrobium antiquum]
MSQNTELISIIVPVYREETNIRPFLQRTEQVMEKLNCPYEIIFCLDPSPDNTEQVILDEIKRNENIRLIRFSRRFGQPAATLAGIHYCKGDACVVIDVDLQDQPELIEQMIEKWQEGYKVVYAKRSSRKGETFFKRWISHFGYRVINKISDVSIPSDTGDFRLMDRIVIDELKKLHESHGFLRGMVAFVGFKQTAIEYERDERASGISNYNRYLGSLKIAFNGIVGFSIKPLQLATLIGAIIAFGAFILGFWILIEKFILNVELTPGLTWTIVLITFLSGVQLLSLGIMGEYVGRIYEEVKQRPLYIVEETENL